MEVAALPPSTTIATFNTSTNYSIKIPKTPLQTCNFCPIATELKPKKNTNPLNLSISTAYSSTRTSAASATSIPSTFTTPPSTTRHWMVSMEAPPRGGNSRAQVIDYYVRTLKRVLGNEKDAQMSIYHASWATHFGFCCDIDEDASRELARVPGVLFARPDANFGSDNKNYGGENLLQLGDSTDSSIENETTDIRTKKLFVAGLSFYTSEKTLRAAFEGFGELVQVKVIMDKISKRSKGYAFVEYSTEEAAAAALKEMNGKIINGWMITVDVARTNPTRSSRGQPRPAI